MGCGLLQSMIPDVCQSFCHAAERIEVLLGAVTLVDAGNIVLSGDPDYFHGFDAAFANYADHLLN